MGATLKAYMHVLRMSAREDSANPGRLLSGVVVMMGRVVLITAIYRIVYEVAGSRAGISYENAMWSVGIYFAFILNLNIRQIGRMVDKEVQQGTVETGLLKPVDWRLTQVFRLFGVSGVEFLLQLVALPIVLLVLVGPPDVSFFSLPMLLVFGVLTLMAIITGLSVFMAVGLSAFWLNDAQPLWRMVDKTALIFGGGFVPIALLPDAVQQFVRYSPFGVYAAPTQLFNEHIVPHLLPMLIASLLWSVVLVAFCQLVWRRAERRIEVNGG